MKNKDAKVIRYTQPAGSPVRAYFSTCVDWAAAFADPEQPIVFTEGEKKALACCLRAVHNRTRRRMELERRR